MQKYDIPKELLNLIPGYLKRRHLELIDLKLFLKNEDFESIAKIGHKLKGNGSSFGFGFITDSGEALMQASTNKDKESVRKIIEEFEAKLSQIKFDPEVDFSE